MLWERRITMMATYHFIHQDDFGDALQLAEILLHDKEDLIHKVVGWMLRELGKRNFDLEDAFLEKHYKSMPRTMLRYAIEKIPRRTQAGLFKIKHMNPKGFFCLVSGFLFLVVSRVRTCFSTRNKKPRNPPNKPSGFSWWYKRNYLGIHILRHLIDGFF